MRNGPMVIAWDIRCPSPSVCAAVREFIEREAKLERWQSVTWTEGGTSREESHRLGDYFRAIRVELPSSAGPEQLRIVFERRPDAGRYWRDLMVRLLQSIHTIEDAVATTLAYRTEDQASETAGRSSVD